MKEDNDSKPKKAYSGDLSLTGMEIRPKSPLNDRVWKLMGFILAGNAAVWGFFLIFGFNSVIFQALIAAAAMGTWGLAVRMLLLDARAKKFWIAWLVFGFFLMFVAPPGDMVWIASVSMAGIFLLFRKYLPFRHLTSKRRALIFLAGLIVFLCMTVIWIGPHTAEDAPPPATWAMSLAQYAVWSLRFFWFFSLFNLFVSMRLHFLKLRSKLAVSAFLISLVPLLLIVSMGLVILYATLGESRALRASAVLESWAELAAADADFPRIISDVRVDFSLPIQSESRTDGPRWIPAFLKSLESNRLRLPDYINEGGARYFLIGSEIWLLRLDGIETSRIRVRGVLLDRRMLDHLARIVHSDVRLSFENPLSIAGMSEKSIRTLTVESSLREDEIAGRLERSATQNSADEESGLSFWHRPQYFGMNHLDVIVLESDSMEQDSILLMVETGLSTITSELFSEDNPMSLIVMVTLTLLMLAMLLLEAFALFFGIRITTGFTSAVKALHKGTRRIADGDLDIHIVLPNEDELGDLAHSINVMAAAVKKGREEELERQRLESELDTAREIQAQLLPHEMPEVPGFEIAGTSLPSQQVGGDYFDFLEVENGHLGIAIADVSGKGIPAALLMANLQASLHAQVIKSEQVAAVADRMNNLLVRSTDIHMFATFFYGVLDRSRSCFTSTNAGHNPPMLFQENGRVQRLEAGGLLLGFLPDRDYAQESVRIQPGEALVMFTDGITEAADPDTPRMSDDLFGEERLIEVIRANLHKSAREIQAAVLQAVTVHIKNSPPIDDITLVVIKRRKDEGAREEKESGRGDLEG